MAAIVLFLYCIFMAYAYGYLFKKPFALSLAPALFLHILLCLFTGIAFGSVTLGVMGGYAACMIIAAWTVFSDIRNRDKECLPKISLLRYLNDTSVIVFIILFIAIIIINEGKCFTCWDEFSHWGMFLKETLRLDKLYCVSPKSFAHKDYVPAVTMFEAIWCTLSLRYQEADVYRAVQILQFSMIFPIFMNGNAACQLVRRENSKTKIDCKELFISIVKLAVIIITLLYIYPYDGLNSLHTIYQDVIFAFLLFYCIYTAYNGSGSLYYDTFVLSLSLTMLVLIKMTGVFFLPFILGMYFVRLKIDDRPYRCKQLILSVLLSGGIPLLLWKSVNLYIGKYVNGIEIQSYDSVRIGALTDVIMHNGAIPYQDKVDESFRNMLSAQFFGDMSVKRSFFVIILILAVLAFFYYDKIKLLLLDLWIFITGLAYVFILYFLYCTQFSEAEAVRAAGVPRYCCSFVYAAILLVLYIICNIKAEKYRPVILLCLCLFLGSILLFEFPDRLSQLLPGYLTGDTEVYRERMEYAKPVTDVAAEDINEKIFCIICSYDYGEFNTLRYDTNPRTLDGGIIGLGREDVEGFSWAWDLTKEQLADEISKYSYVYFKSVDDLFIRSYADAFAEPEKIKDKTIYKSSVENGRIVLKDCN